MKKLILSFAMALISVIAFSQHSFNGKRMVNFGLGVASGIPLYVGYELGVHADVTVGGEVGAVLGHKNFTVFTAGATGNYHFNRLLNIPSNIDFYAGVGLGIALLSYKSGHMSHTSNGIDLGWDIHLGGRYYFNSKWGANLQLGAASGAGSGRLGLTYRL